MFCPMHKAKLQAAEEMARFLGEMKIRIETALSAWESDRNGKKI